MHCECLGMECLIKSSIKNTVNNTEESFKSGIPKNGRKIDITFDFLALKKGPCGWGWTGSDNHFFEAIEEAIAAIN